MDTNIGTSITTVNQNIYNEMNKNSDMDKLDTLGARLRWARERRKMTQQAAAKAVGLRQPTLSALENNDSKGTASLIEFSQTYGVDARWLKTGRGSPDTDGKQNVKSSNTDVDGILSIESAREERARLLAETMLDVSTEMRALIDRLIQADLEGGAIREMTIAGVGYVLQSIPAPKTQKKAK